ncbi:MAG TPA: hypothetical protein ENK43_09925 [Planctomycetes bacterium]|nr:hypothetical protein [Planctomycetota bacterium]
MRTTRLRLRPLRHARPGPRVRQRHPLRRRTPRPPRRLSRCPRRWTSPRCGRRFVPAASTSGVWSPAIAAPGRPVRGMGRSPASPHDS